MIQRQKILVLYLSTSALDTHVVGWATYDGTGEAFHMAGDDDTPPYKTGLDALLDGWRLIQANPMLNHTEGSEYRTGYLKYEFWFEKLVQVVENEQGECT